MLPALVGSIGAIYSIGKGYDTWKYWNDYKKNTGFSPRYPFRYGSMDYLKYGAGAGFSFSKLKKL